MAQLCCNSVWCLATSSGAAVISTRHAKIWRGAQAPAQAAAPKQLHGFELVREQFVPEYNSHVMMYRHAKTGSLPG